MPGFSTPWGENEDVSHFTFHPQLQQQPCRLTKAAFGGTEKAVCAWPLYAG